MRLIVLRPPTRATATLARIAAPGGEGVNLPLFALEKVAWTVPDPAGFDALVLTSANAVSLAGPGLASVASLPVWAVGEATAQAARHAGLAVAQRGDRDAATLFAEMAAAGIDHALWLTGEDRRPAPLAPRVTAIETYRAVPMAIDPALLAGGVVLLHSPRAAAILAARIDGRACVHLAAISRATADAAGPGWASVTVAAEPSDAALVAAAIDRARAHADKRPR